ncbi:hypothetical protein [Natronorubrum sp. DTA7]|uniref:hypothetical protein n=1 Tax=Natronorubrum sp. DTA7 TaxID=3447016 RepID=UPI003F845921
MTGTTIDSRPLDAPWWVLLQAVAMSAFLFGIGEAWVVVSLEATAVAVVTGAIVGVSLLGLAVSVGFGSFSDRRQIALLGAFIAVSMASSLLVPREHGPTLFQFWLAALWSTTLAVLARGR